MKTKIIVLNFKENTIEIVEASKDDNGNISLLENIDYSNSHIMEIDDDTRFLNLENLIEEVASYHQEIENNQNNISSGILLGIEKVLSLIYQSKISQSGFKLFSDRLSLEKIGEIIEEPKDDEDPKGF